MKNPKVSIIIPVYNGSNYLKEAIDSALLQTYDNIEILVINDGSNDGGKTRSVALSYKDKIKYIEKDNGGVSTALNLGIENMTGDYFSWLSHDDLYEPDKVLKQVNELLKYGDRTVVYSNYNIVDENTNLIGSVVLNHDEYMANPLQSIINMDINGITLLIPKKAFDECGVFDENLRCVQDYDLWVKIMKTYKFIHMKDILASSRVHSKQVSNVSSRVVLEGNCFYKNLVSSIDLETKVRYFGSEYLFLDNLENKLRYGSNYLEAADYIKGKRQNLLCKYNNDCKLLWLINSEDKSIDYLNELIKNNKYKNLEIGVYGKKIKGFSYFSKSDLINKSKYNYVYLGENLVNFVQMISILEVSGASIIGNYLLEECNMAHLDKYSKFLHLDQDSIIIRNSGIKVCDLQDRCSLFYSILENGNLVINEKVKKEYSISDSEMNNFLINILSDKNDSKFIASVGYQIAVIHNRQSLKTGEKKVKFYESCDKYNELKYSRLWNLYNKFVSFVKRKK